MSAPPTPSRDPSPSAPDVIVLSRADLDAALADFDRLGRDVDARLGADGVSLARVAPTSIFARIGLRAGDRVTAVDGRAIRSLDDAASLYARITTATRLIVEVTRGRERVTLRVEVTK